uniref:Uncharacterized protein n=1 Tax=Arundo donax TaxID=35708 RepID=A0A0A9AEJ8_ARUDO
MRKQKCTAIPPLKGLGDDVVVEADVVPAMAAAVPPRPHQFRHVLLPLRLWLILGSIRREGGGGETGKMTDQSIDPGQEQQDARDGERGHGEERKRRQTRPNPARKQAAPKIRKASERGKKEVKVDGPGERLIDLSKNPREKKAIATKWRSKLAPG